MFLFSFVLDTRYCHTSTKNVNLNEELTLTTVLRKWANLSGIDCTNAAAEQRPDDHTGQ